jgi:hypothetical protein
MRRFAVAVAIAVAVGFSAMPGTPAEAAKKVTYNLCKGKDNVGKNISWKCGLEEKCCWQPAINKAACVAKTGVCI